MIEFSDSYRFFSRGLFNFLRDSWECNFLGLRFDAKVPDYLDPSSYALVDITQKDDVCTFDYIGKTTTRTTLGTDIEKIIHLQLPRDLEFERLRLLKEDWIK